MLGSVELATSQHCLVVIGSMHVCACVHVIHAIVSVCQTHHTQCPAEPRMFPDVNCSIFNSPKPMTMALSVLVVIEMLNSLNR